LRIVSWEDSVSGRGGFDVPSAATVGVFDGLHLGHRELIARVIAKSPQLIPIAVTFRDNPKKVTKPNVFSGNLFSMDQKLEALAETGIQVCVLIDFSGNFSKLAGSEFVSTLVQSCYVRSFVVGSDFRCGFKLSTDAQHFMELARSIGAETEIVSPVSVEGETVSSSRIRSALAEGRLDLARSMLGRPYTLDLRRMDKCVDGSFGTVMLQKYSMAEPAPGVYRALAMAGQTSQEIEVSIRADGSLHWPLAGFAQNDEPEFLVFGARIA
jgi:riboflavin kinase / FMN adenylyltransferase